MLGLALLEGAITATLLGIVLAARSVGFLFAMPVSGVLADRFPRRRVIWGASVIAASGIPLIVAGLELAAAHSGMLMMLGATISGIGQGACRPAYQAMVPVVVGRGALQAANAAMTISVRVTTLVGPMLATALALAIGLPVALAVVGALWLISAYAPPNPPEPTRHGERRLTFKRLGLDLIEGAQEARRHTWFMAGLAALTIVIALGYSAAGVILPIVSRDHHGGPWLLVAATTAYTVGALFGAVLIAHWRPRNQGWAALGGLALYGFVPFSLMAPGHAAIPIAAFFLAGVGIELFNVPWFTATQREVPEDKLARVTSLDFLLSYGLAPLGLAAIAPLGQAFGFTTVLAVSGCACLLAPMAAMLPRSSRAFTTSPKS
jgi:MFS family permease